MGIAASESSYLKGCDLKVGGSLFRRKMCKRPVACLGQLLDWWSVFLTDLLELASSNWWCPRVLACDMKLFTF